MFQIGVGYCIERIPPGILLLASSDKSGLAIGTAYSTAWRSKCDSCLPDAFAKVQPVNCTIRPGSISATAVVMAIFAQAYSVALQCHQAGKLEQAEQLYQQVLEADP